MCRILVPICSSDICCKIDKTLALSSACRMVTRETQATKVADPTAPQRVPGDISALAVLKTFLTQEKIIIAHTGLCCLLLPKKQTWHMGSIWLLPKGHSIAYINLKIKYRAKINNGMRFNIYLSWKMTLSIHLTIRCRNKNSSVIMKKKVLIINAKQGLNQNHSFM